MQEINSRFNSDKHKEFEKLLNAELSKANLKEGNIVEGTVTAIGEKFITISVEGAKSDGIIDINEFKILKEDKDIKIGSKISVLVEKIENREGSLVISREKAKKMKSWKNLQKSFEKNEEVTGKIQSKIKGGFIVEVDSALCFLPNSQLDLRPLKNVDHLMNEPQKFKIVKCDKIRGNVVLSRRIILEGLRDATKDEIISKFNLNDEVTGVCKGVTTYGAFFDINGFDSMCHINEISWSRVAHPDEIFSIGQKQKLKIISIDKVSKKISVSIKRLNPDPFETKINNYEVGKVYKAEVKKIMDYGIFLSLEDGLEGLCHSSQLSHTNKNISGKKLFAISEKIEVMVKEIDVEKRRISLSFKDTIPNPWEEFANKFSIGSKIKGTVKNITQFALFVEIKNTDLDGMVHYKDLSYDETDEDLKKFKKNQELELKILEIDQEKEKIRLGLKQLLPDPLNFFKDRNKKDIITTIIKEIVDNGIKVSPDGCNIKFLIKKNQIAVDKEDQRVTRFTKGDRIDVMIQECDLKKRKISLSIKMLEEEQNKTAIKKYGSVDSGKSLPFADLPSTLKKKNEKDK